MPTRYATGHTKTSAELISAALYRLSRPATVRDPNDATVFAVEVIKHPDRSDRAVVVPDELLIPIHPDADTAEIKAIYAAEATQEERDTFAAGGVVEMTQLLPSTAVARLKTAEQMTGWFVSPFGDEI